MTLRATSSACQCAARRPHIVGLDYEAYGDRAYVVRAHDATGMVRQRDDGGFAAMLEVPGVGTYWMPVDCMCAGLLLLCEMVEALVEPYIHRIRARGTPA